MKLRQRETYMVFNNREALHAHAQQQPDWSERVVRKDAGRPCRSLQISYWAGPRPGVF